MRNAFLLLVIVVLAAIVPRVWLGREPARLFDGDRATQDALAREVIAYAERDVDEGAFHTGSALFDGEWAFGTHQMTLLALGQIVLEHPELRDAYVPAMRRAADRLVDAGTLRFAASRWGEDPIAALDGDHGHAYLGYAALALGMLRAVDPETPHAALHDRIEAALARRLARAPHALIETYPGESYPPDVLAVAGSLGLHQRVTGADHRALLDAWSRTFRARWIDASGYLVQAGDARTGEARDAPRGSGTAIGAYFASFVDRDMARTLDEGLARRGHATFLGFGGVREGAEGDIDSGPVLLGVGVSATGFALASARIHGDRDRYVELARTAWLFGVPVDREGGGRRFVAGGPLGNALLLAMLTARAS
ncbi:hypothetical protein [Sandaracinus amylolyticus]|uniref:hypothetical protein n=1 Tax=Sandaracinus amylolyticus TaxID=927083 RepID=UPI00069DE3C2|nr:hypothetical protein [Sandaracinus amylolyticus]